jgi:paraquat-inducible protein B
LYVAFDFFPNPPPATIDWDQTPVELPTIPGELQEIEANVGEIIKKLNQVPFKGISDDLQRTLTELDRTLVTARGTFDRANGLVESADGLVGNANTLIQPNSALGMQLGNTLQEVSNAARGLRILADYLERHPEALIRGKPGEAK